MYIYIYIYKAVENLIVYGMLPNEVYFFNTVPLALRRCWSAWIQLVRKVIYDVIIGTFQPTLLYIYIYNFFHLVRYHLQRLKICIWINLVCL